MICTCSNYTGAPYCAFCQESIDYEQAEGSSFLCGAAVAFGLMAMAEAIASNLRLRACHDCGVATSSRCFPSGWNGAYRCMPCNNAAMVRECFPIATPRASVPLPNPDGMPAEEEK